MSKLITLFCRQNKELLDQFKSELNSLISDNEYEFIADIATASGEEAKFYENFLTAELVMLARHIHSGIMTQADLEELSHATPELRSQLIQEKKDYKC